VPQTSLANESLPAWLRPRGSLLSECPVPGCTTLTMGGTCVAHDPPVSATFVRGRPFAARAAAPAEAGRLSVPS
jgi:hypothetical protein